MRKANYLTELENELATFQEEFNTSLRQKPFTDSRRTFVLKQITKLQVEISQIKSKERS